MTQEELNERAKKAVLTYNINESKKVAQDALDQNADIVDLIQNGYTITDRQYLGFEPESGYHHYTVDVAQYYEYETEER